MTKTTSGEDSSLTEIGNKRKEGEEPVEASGDQVRLISGQTRGGGGAGGGATDLHPR